MSGGKPKYQLRPKARSDLEAIWRYAFETWSLEQADSYIQQIIDVIESTADGRRHGKSCDEVRPGYHRIRANSHVMFYKKTEDGIDVVRILHGRMDFVRHLS